MIAERGGENLGSVAVTPEDDDVARLRILLVEPAARGLGLGGRLVDECLEFARSAGYSKMKLSTFSVLTGARRIYERAGFRVVSEQADDSIGHDLVHETWEIELRGCETGARETGA